MEKCTCPVPSSFTMAVLSYRLSEGAGLDRTLEREFMLLLTQLEALALRNPGHTFPPEPEHTAFIRAGAQLQQSPATGRVVPLAAWCHRPHGATGLAATSRSRSSSTETLPCFQSWGCKSSSCSSAKAIEPVTLGLDPMPSVCWSGARHGISWKQELPLQRNVCIHVYLWALACPKHQIGSLIFGLLPIFMHLNIASCVNNGCSTPTASVLS